MDIEVTISRTDFLELNKFVHFRNRLKRSFGIATFFIIVWLFILNKNGPFNILSILVQLIVFYAAWGLLIFLLRQLTIWKIKKYPDENGALLGKKTYQLSDEGIREITDNSETLTKWKGIQRIEETNEYVFVFVDRIAAYIFPKREFKSKEELGQFLETLKEKAKK